MAESPPAMHWRDPFRVRSFRFQWPADLATSWAFEMESIVLGWFILVESGSVMMLVVFGSLQYLGSLGLALVWRGGAIGWVTAACCTCHGRSMRRWLPASCCWPGCKPSRP